MMLILMSGSGMITIAETFVGVDVAVDDAVVDDGAVVIAVVASVATVPIVAIIDSAFCCFAAGAICKTNFVFFDLSPCCVQLFVCLFVCLLAGLVCLLILLLLLLLVLLLQLLLWLLLRLLLLLLLL